MLGDDLAVPARQRLPLKLASACALKLHEAIADRIKRGMVWLHWNNDMPRTAGRHDCDECTAATLSIKVGWAPTQRIGAKVASREPNHGVDLRSCLA